MNGTSDEKRERVSPPPRRDTPNAGIAPHRPAVAPARPLIRLAETQANEKTGRAIYRFLLDHRGQEFTRREIERHIAPGERHLWHRVMAYWDAAHPDSPIRAEDAATARTYRVD